MTPVENIKAIDVHAHIGKYVGDNFDLVNNFASGDAEVILSHAQKANTEFLFVSPLNALLPRLHGDPVTANREIISTISGNARLKFWVVIDPLKPKTYDQADEMLSLKECVGIKIHPEEHGYAIADYGEAIFEFAAEKKAVLLTHSGEKNSLPQDFVSFANDFSTVKLILAHLGCGWDGDPSYQVRAVHASKYGNIYIDTSSAKNTMPGLIEWAVKKIGAEKILYGTDTPLYFAPMQRARIDHAYIPETDKAKILHENAIKLFSYKSDIY